MNVQGFRRGNKREGGLRPIDGLARSQQGAAAIEFAFVVPLALLLIFASVETGLFFAARHNLQNAVYDASRLGRTGQGEDDAAREAIVRERLQNRVRTGLLNPGLVQLDVRSYERFGDLQRPEPFEDRNGNGRWDEGEAFIDINGNGRWDADRGREGLGGAAAIVLYEASYEWMFFTPMIGALLGQDGRLTMIASAVVQNEPY